MLKFRDAIICSGLETALSPNLNVYGFNLWGTIKYKIYRSNPYTKSQRKMSEGNLLVCHKELPAYNCKFLWVCKSLHTITRLKIYLITFECTVSSVTDKTCRKQMTLEKLL
jgi:hypothetical protein